MARYFGRRSNTIARASLVGLPLVLACAGWAAWEVENSGYVTGQDVVIEQPVPFSHRHHVGGLGIDCRYCHTSVTESSFAGVPPTRTCMTCHSQIWTNAPMLQPVRDSWRTDTPIQWKRVHNLPNYVYFDHSIHVAKGVGCATCHGEVDDMPLMSQARTLQMRWCLDCHKDPAKNLRPREEVFNLHYVPAGDQEEIGRRLVKEYGVRSPQALTDCWTCHR